MLESLDKIVPEALAEYIPQAIDNIDITPDALRRSSTWTKFFDILPSVIAIILLAMLFIYLFKRAVMFHQRIKSARLADPEDVKRLHTVGRVFLYAMNIVITLAAVMMIFDKIGIAVAPLLGAAGVVGIAVGFGAQSLIKDYFTGLFLIIENQIRQGDVIMIADKEGLVETVTLRHVRLRDVEGNVHFVPNGLITTVTNKSRGFGFAVCDVGVAYDTDIDACLEVMKKVGEELQKDPVFGEKIIEVLEIFGIDAIAASSINLRARFKTKPMEQWGVRREYLKRLKQAFDAAGIEIPFPQMVMHTPKTKKLPPPPAAQEGAE